MIWIIDIVLAWFAYCWFANTFRLVQSIFMYPSGFDIMDIRVTRIYLTFSSSLFLLISAGLLSLHYHQWGWVWPWNV